MRSAILILIVDEQEDRRRLLARELSAEGFGAVHASTALGAFRIIEQQRPDLVVARDLSLGTLLAPLAEHVGSRCHELRGIWRHAPSRGQRVWRR